jgi:septal ring-binding cell division protein DamX
MFEMVTSRGVTVQFVLVTRPEWLVTVNVYVLLPVSAGVTYDCPLIAAAVISELPTPVEPITAVPPSNVATNITGESKRGVVELGTSVAVIACTESEQPVPYERHATKTVVASKSSKMDLHSRTEAHFGFRTIFIALIPARSSGACFSAFKIFR